MNLILFNSRQLKAYSISLSVFLLRGYNTQPVVSVSISLPDFLDI